VIDLHSHLLPGLDDGAATIEDSRELARMAAADGIDCIAATPHVRADYPTTAGQMEAAVQTVREDFAAQGIPVEVLHGGEVALDQLAALGLEELRRFTIAQTGRYLLVEFPYRGWPLALEQQLFDLSLKGITAILAHPERNAEVQARPERLRAAVDQGALVQVTAASLDGRIGRRAKGTADALVRSGMVHLLASDAHTPEVREVGLSRAVEALNDSTLARFLTQEAPAAIVAGELIPARPEAATRSRRLFRR
jgi:protein-tyrosine phosphatase